MEVLEIAVLASVVTGFTGFVMKIIFEKSLERFLDKRFEQMDNESKAKEEKDYMVIKGIIMITEHQRTIIEALKRAKIDENNNFICINGELSAVEKDIENYNHEWQDYLIRHQRGNDE